ncbi:Mur ligase family protein [Clostridium frigidicarnis]|uniref:UDP-N-acetylmuramyl tripeptide synthase n=1 Tax=Clostridium frigidicarnis TaxID=84698 RepID=A0A1I1AF10_9CLOT|nr:Mur ligase family protein [Clostridium frigidicarnis]SFB34933.1 UDP-N-acetylmuramyl tripeptide synthase [Clostridium frigidicarnis]
MSIKLIRFIDGYEINGYKRVVRCVFNKGTSIDEINKVMDEYIIISKILGCNEEIKDIIKLSEEFNIFVTYTNENIAQFILRQLEKNSFKKYIIRKGRNIKKYIWNEDIIKCVIEKNMPFIEVDKNTLQIGYGKNLTLIDKNRFNDEFSKDINKLYKYIIDKNIGRIPLISVTGTNGKTTTSRLIHNILLKLGRNSGMASTGGVYIKDKKILSGDTTGYLSARMVLENPGIDIGVLETARGGIIKKGLGYLESDIAIITSISEDHIGVDGIKNLDELAAVKAITLKALKNNGKAIVPYNKHILKFIDEKRYKVCYFSIKPISILEKDNNPNIELIFLKENHLIYIFDGKEHNLGNIKKINFCHNGISKSNIKNIMCAVAALKEFYELDVLIDVINKLECDLNTNSGRQNILDIKDFKVVLDYGHNPEAFEEIFSIAKELKHEKIISIIAAPGDRKDKYIKELGRIAAKNSNKIIIREQDDLRERKVGETANLLKQGALNNNFKEKDIEIIYKEEDAILESLNKAEKNDVIILFTQCLDVIIPVINKYLKTQGLNQLEVNADLLSH